MADGWRYIALRLTGGDCPTDEFLDLNLPLQDVSITDTLSGPPALQASLTPEVSRLMAHDGPVFQQWSTAIFAEKDGHIRGGGIVQPITREGTSLRLSCMGYTAYPAEQPWTDPDGYVGIGVDPIDVVRVIWDHLQSQPGGNLFLELDRTTMAGYTIGSKMRVATFDPQDDPDTGPTSFEVGPVLLRHYETFDLGSEINKYAEQTPFDYHERHEWDGDENIRHFLDFGYPRLGRRREDLRFVYGENIMAAPSISDSEYATEVVAFGAGEGRTMLNATRSNRANLQLRRAVVVTNKAAKTQRDVNALARRELAGRGGGDNVTQFVMYDHTHAPLGSVEMGDEIYIAGRTGWKDLGMWVRVVGQTLRPADGGAIELSVIRSGKMGA